MFTLLNSPEFVFCYLAAHKISAVACPVSGRAQARLHSSLTARPRLSSTTPDSAKLSGDARPVRASLPSRSLSARTMPYLPVRCAMRITCRSASRLRPASDETTRPIHLRHNQPSGRADQQYQRGAFRDVMMLPSRSDRPHGEHDRGSTAASRPIAGSPLCGRRSCHSARFCTKRCCREITTFSFPDRCAD